MKRCTRWPFLKIIFIKDANNFDKTRTVCISSKVAKNEFNHSILFSHYCRDKTIAWSGDVNEDAKSIVSLFIKHSSMINTSVQNFAVRISSVKTLPKSLSKQPQCESNDLITVFIAFKHY